MSFFNKVHQRYRYSAILLRELVRTDFKVRYQNSVLGYVWSLLRPLFMFIVLYIIFVKFLGIGKEIAHWPVALFMGLVLWQFFNEITKQGLKAVVGQGGIIRKINFPKYIIIVSSSLSALINLLLNLVVVAIFVLITKTPISWGYLWIPLYIVELYIFSLGLAFLLGTMYVKVRDINFIWEIITQAGFYGSAVMFPMSRIFNISHSVGQIFLLNPVTQIIQDSRHAMLSHIPSSFAYMNNALLSLVPFVVVVFFLFIGAWYFRKRSPDFAEEV